jgi:membrane protease subunit HflC
MKNLAIGIVAILGALLAIFFSATVIVKDTELGLVHNTLTKAIRVLPNSDIYFIVPFVERKIIYSSKYYNVDSPPENIVTGDQQKLILDNFVKWKILDPKLFRDRFKQNLFKAQDRVSKIAHNALKDVIGKKNLRDIIAKEREAISTQALLIAKEQGLGLGIEIKDIRIKKVDMPESNVTKAFQRMKAERNKEANLFKAKGIEAARGIKAEVKREVQVIRANGNKKAKIIRAGAEAKASEIYLAAHNQDPEFYSFYRSLQALKKTLDDSTTLVISPKSELFKYLSRP